MPLYQTKTPKRLVSGTNYSTWVTAFNPVIYEYERVDLGVIDITDNGGKVQVNCDGPVGSLVGSASGSTSPDKIYLKSGPYAGTYTVNSLVGYNSIVLDYFFIGSATGGKVNLVSYHKNYRIEIRVLTKVPGGSQLIEVSNDAYRPDPTGFLRVDIQDSLRALFTRAKDEFKYDVINMRDDNLAAFFDVRYREIWDGNPEGDELVDPDRYKAIYSAKQLLDKWGSNVAESVPFLDTTLDEADRAKFLSDFDRPTYFPGWPFDISFIFPKEISGYECYRRETRKDVNNNTITNNFSALDSLQADGVNRLQLQEGYPGTVKNIILAIVYDDGIAVTASGAFSTDYVADSEAYVSPDVSTEENEPLAQESTL